MQKSMISKRSLNIKELPMYALVTEARKLELAGQKVLHMEIGSTTGFHNEELVALLRKHAQTPDVGYCPSGGTFDLRQTIADLYSKEKSANFTVDNVAIAPANAAITQIQAVVADPGEAVLLPDPGFPTYRLGAIYNGLNILNYRLYQEKEWNPKVSEIADTMDRNPNLRMIFINTPSNPLGAAIDNQIIDEILEIAAKRNIIAVVDETYKNLLYSDKIHQFSHRNTNLYLYSFSKDAAVPGLRMGCVVGDREVISKINEFSSMFFSCQPPLFQTVINAYLLSGKKYYEEISSNMRNRIAKVDSILRKSKRISYVLPNAAFYVFVNIGALGVNAEEFSLRLLKEAGICICPGSSFGPTGGEYIRLTISTPESELYLACERFVDYVERF